MDNNLKFIPYWINGRKIYYHKDEFLTKKNPHNDSKLYNIPVADNEILIKTINFAQNGYKKWSLYTPLARAKIITVFIQKLKKNKNVLTKIIKKETGKSINDSKNEFDAAINQGEFFVGEGYRLNGKTLNSGIKNKTSFTIKAPHGVVGLIVSANTPIANIAWKIFPALITGNSIILKSSEDAPLLAYKIAEISDKCGFPNGTINLIHGDGRTGSLMTNNSGIKFISFTGSSLVGKDIIRNSSKNITRISLELGGNNSMYISYNSNINNAIEWVMKSGYSNAGQRCAGLNRLIVHKKIYKIFKTKLISEIKKIKLGINNDCYYGPVISEKQLNKLQDQIQELKSLNYKIILGGRKSNKKLLKKGYYFEPSLLEFTKVTTKLYDEEIFGPIIILFCVENLKEALKIANDTKFGLTSCIHSNSINEIMEFIKNIRAGVVNSNMGTHGSEPHYPFGGFGISGNGTREPGDNAIDLYTELKIISLKHD